MKYSKGNELEESVFLHEAMPVAYAHPKVTSAIWLPQATLVFVGIHSRATASKCIGY